MVTSQAVAYPDLAPGASASGSIPFQFTVSSSVPCGAALSFTVTASYAEAGGPSVRDFAEPTGEPPTTSTFAYTGAPVAIPDNIPRRGQRDDRRRRDHRSSHRRQLRLRRNVLLGGDRVDDRGPRPHLGRRPRRSLDLSHRDDRDAHDPARGCEQPTGTTSARPSWTMPGRRRFRRSPSRVIRTLARSSRRTRSSTLNGQNPNGTWTLNVRDVAAQDTGSIRQFSLRISSQACNSALATPARFPRQRPTRR